MTGIELKYVTTAHLELTGNCYWLLDGVKNDTDQLRAIYPLNPGRVKVKLDKTSFPSKIGHYEFTIELTKGIRNLSIQREPCRPGWGVGRERHQPKPH